MADEVIQVEIDAKLSASSVNSIKADLGKSVSETLSVKRQQIQKDTESLIYKKGFNSSKTRANLASLGYVSRAENRARRDEVITEGASDRERIKTEKIEEKLQEDIFLKKQKTAREEIKTENEKLKLTIKQRKENEKLSSSETRKGFFGDASFPSARNLDVFNNRGNAGTQLSFEKSAGLLNNFGKIGGIAAAVALAVKVAKDIVGNPITYGARGLGTSFGGAGEAALLNGRVVTKEIGQDFADTLDANKLDFSPENRFRTPQITGAANRLAVQFGQRTFEPLRHISQTDSQADVYKKIETAIRTGSETAALAAGKAFNFSEKEVLAIRNGRSLIGETLSASEKTKRFNDPGVIKSAISTTGAIDKVTGNVNLGATNAVVTLTSSIEKLNSTLQAQRQNESNLFPNSPTNKLSNYFYNYGLPGNTAAGNV